VNSPSGVSASQNVQPLVDALPAASAWAIFPSGSTVATASRLRCTGRSVVPAGSRSAAIRSVTVTAYRVRYPARPSARRYNFYNLDTRYTFTID
jgi:hypothetical protein